MATKTSAEALADKIDLALCASHVLMFVETYEDRRAWSIIQKVSKLPDHAQRGLYYWSCVKGLVRVNGKREELPGTEKFGNALDEIAGLGSGIVVMFDAVPYLNENEPRAIRQLKELAWAVNGQDPAAEINESKQLTVILVGAKPPDIPSLQKEMYTVKLELPDEDELRTLVREQAVLAADTFTVKLSDEDVDRLANTLLGQTFQEAQNALAKAIVEEGEFSAKCITVVTAEKAALINSIPGCHYTEPTARTNFGGYGTAVQVIEDAVENATSGARAFGCETYSGFAFTGAPGTGKSYLATIVAAMMGLSLTRVDLGELMGSGGGIFGQAEVATSRLLDALSRMGGVVLVDEADKLFQGLASSGQTDGGTTSRVIGTWMTWLAQPHKCLVIFTMNDATKVNPAILRAGRIDYVLFFGLPVWNERAKIAAIHLRKRDRDPEEFDLVRFALATNGFSGAEIEATVKRTITQVWREAHGARRITTDDLIAASRTVNPLSEMSPDEIKGMTEWARKAQAITANDPEEALPALGTEPASGARKMIARRS